MLGCKIVKDEYNYYFIQQLNRNFVLSGSIRSGSGFCLNEWIELKCSSTWLNEFPSILAVERGKRALAGRLLDDSMAEYLGIFGITKGQLEMIYWKLWQVRYCHKFVNYGHNMHSVSRINLINARAMSWNRKHVVPGSYNTVNSPQLQCNTNTRIRLSHKPYFPNAGHLA